MKLPKQKYPIVQIVWEDISSPDTGWIKPEKVHEPGACLITSVGYLIAENEQYVFYASDIAEDGTANGVTQIPRPNVKHLKVIKKVSSGKAKKTNLSTS